jgi:tRNA dimethylallyltransferase
MNNRLIIVSGPTATGKTRTSIDIAEKIPDAVIVNFDSLLFYKEISIGTAKPTQEEQKNIPHYMIDVASITSPMNAADFIKMALVKMLELFEQNRTIILVGGSAFYLRALLKGMYESTPPTPEIKNRIDSLYEEKGIEGILDYLKKNDPESIQNYHINDHYRLTRAALHFESTGTKISDQKNNLDEKDPYDFNEIIHPWNILHLYLDLPKDEHFEIIKSRTEKMFKDGLLQEIESLSKAGFTLSEKPLTSIGYKEAIEYKNGAFKSLEECIERISISTRQLAKSQRTFFNKIHPKLNYNPLTDREKIFSSVEQFIRKC